MRPPPPRAHRPSPGVTSLAGLALLSGLQAACEADAPRGGEPVPWSPPAMEAAEGPVERTGLRSVVRLGEEADGPALRRLLADPDPLVRGRAAFVLASVQDPDALPDLEALLDDPEPRVRADAAFALGRLPAHEVPREETAPPLARALETEEEPAVRRRIVEALGTAGDEAALVALLGAEGVDEPARTLAVSRLGVAGVEHPELVPFLAARLRHDDGEVRRNAAYYFGRVADGRAWLPVADSLRAALDAYAPAEPAAMHLLTALWQLQSPEDLPRAVRWLGEATDWRIRANAAGAFGESSWAESGEGRDALLRALGDPSLHVAVSAAHALASRFDADGGIGPRVSAWMQENPSRWPAAVPFVDGLAAAGEEAFLVRWAEQVGRDHPGSGTAAVRALAGVSGSEVDAFLFRAAASGEPLVRGEATGALAGRWRTARDMVELEGYYLAFVDALRSGEPFAVMEAAGPLGHPIFHAFGALPVLEETYRELAPRGFSRRALEAIVDAMGEAAEPEWRAGLDEELPFRSVEWEALEAWGPAPRLALETEQGRIVLRLAPDEAPQTAHAILRLAADGRYDGVPFHRVVPNFVVQGGDVGEGDGLGGPGFRIRTELTRIPFVRGVVGMASSGKDTEGSQFFIVHSMQPHLDAGYTAFGWVEEGMDVVDRIQEGDRILEARPVAGEGTAASP